MTFSVKFGSVGTDGTPPMVEVFDNAIVLGVLDKTTEEARRLVKVGVRGPLSEL
jgi:hypothetical protein